MNGTRSVLICGATGLVGSHCLKVFQEYPAFDRVVALTRRPLPDALRGGERLSQCIVDFDRLGQAPGCLQADTIVCALGTTIRTAGSREQFRRVDFEYPLAIARIGLERGARHFLLVSSIGADSHSRFFYNRVKGEIEGAIRALPYRSITIVRPSLLLGLRQEKRLGEDFAKHFGWAMPGRFKPVHAHDVALVLGDAALRNEAGLEIIESISIIRRARRLTPRHGDAA